MGAQLSTSTSTTTTKTTHNATQTAIPTSYPETPKSSTETLEITTQTSDPPLKEDATKESNPPLLDNIKETPENPKLETNLEGQEAEEEEEKGECGFCMFMKGGACRDSFINWENCVKDADKNKEDVVDKCSEATSALVNCMKAHLDYYEPVFRAEEAAAEKEKGSKPKPKSNQETPEYPKGNTNLEGDCKDGFLEWEKCIDEAEKNNEDIGEKCDDVAEALKKCNESHQDYNEPLKAAMAEAAVAEPVQALEKEEKCESKAVGVQELEKEEKGESEGIK